MAFQANLYKFFSRDSSRSSSPVIPVPQRHQDDVVVEDEKHNKNSNNGEEKDEKQSTHGEGKIATTEDLSEALKPSTAYLRRPIFPCSERRRTQGRAVSRMRILRDLPDDGDECVDPHQTHESSEDEEEEEDNSCSKSSSSTSSSSAASLPKDFEEDVYSLSSSSSYESDGDSSSSPEKDGSESECTGERTRNAKGKRKQMQEHSKATKSTKRIRKRV